MANVISYLSIIEVLSNVSKLSLNKFAYIKYETTLKFRKHGGLSESQITELFGGGIKKVTRMTFLLGRDRNKSIQAQCLREGVNYVANAEKNGSTWLKKGSGVTYEHSTTGQKYLAIVPNRNSKISTIYVDFNGKEWIFSDIEKYLLIDKPSVDKYQTETLGLKNPINFYLINLENIREISFGGTKLR